MEGTGQLAEAEGGWGSTLGEDWASCISGEPYFEVAFLACLDGYQSTLGDIDVAALAFPSEGVAE